MCTVRNGTVGVVETGVGPLLVRAWRQQTGGDQAGTYDEVLREVSTRARAEESLGKADVGALVLWKRITAQSPWVTRLLLTPEDEVRKITGAAYEAANDPCVVVPVAGQAARAALWDLPGMQGTGALASAVLVALAPTRMAVWDRRVRTSLESLGCRPRFGEGFYGRYLTTLLDLSATMGASPDGEPFTPRDVDVALFAMAESPDLLDEARACAVGSRL